MSAFSNGWKLIGCTVECESGIFMVLRLMGKFNRLGDIIFLIW